ncbi:MAG TPA: HAD-IA family hydrolase [archaeon]|nr:HAD-IA family hydrolase [archaeon]
MVKALVFDMNGLFVEAQEKRILKKICSIKRIDPWIAESNYYLNLWNFQKGFFSPFAFWKKVFPFISEQEYKAFVEAEYEKRFEKNFELYSLCEQLSKKYALYCISNSNFLQGKAYRKQKLYSPFKELFLSHELGEMKPFSGAYKKFLEKTELKASECLFIDDSRINVLSAMLLGFKGIVYKDFESLSEKLNSL